MNQSSLTKTLELVLEQVINSPDKGDVANYIPELAKISPNQFGLSLCMDSGEQFSFGDSDTFFSIQSISKVFTLAIALGRYGNSFWRRIGREPSTNVFNSIQELETRKGIPSNPYVNAGAIVTTDSLLVSATPKDTLAEILSFMKLASSSDDIFVDKHIALSEKETGHQNWALAHVLKAQGNLVHDCELTLGTYFHHCAIEMNCEQLARSGRFLAGISPNNALISNNKICSINSLMMTCGHYNGSGAFAYRVGIPAKSGVGGGILAIVPGVASIAVWSPGLDNFGNSLLGTLALEMISKSFGWSVFSVEKGIVKE